MTQNPLLEVARIVEDWEDGHHGLFPMILCYDPETPTRPFFYRQGCGFGAMGIRLTLAQLFERSFAQNFDHPESRWVFELLEQHRQQQTEGQMVGLSLVEAYTERFGQAPTAPKL